MNKRTAWVSIIVIFLISASFTIFRSYRNTDTRYQTYRQPYGYAITYPKGWRRQGGQEKNGYEILSLYSYNYRKVAKPGSGFSSGQVKIALNILEQGTQSLEQIVETEFKKTEKGFTQKVLTINDRRAIRVTAVLENEESVSPVIETFIEYKDRQYAWLIGYYDGAANSAREIIKIHDSFQALE